MDQNELFLIAYQTVCENGYYNEIEYVRNIQPLELQDDVTFFREYVWVVLNAGMKEQVARRIFDKFMDRLDILTIGHLGKRDAIRRAINEYQQWFVDLKKSDDKLEYLTSLPWIGDITKHHLARNIGIDTVKPDRHLVRLAKEYGFKTPMDLCVEIQKTFHEPLGVIDVILWRFCNLYN
jgi:hypothetical protein